MIRDILRRCTVREAAEMNSLVMLLTEQNMIKTDLILHTGQIAGLFPALNNNHSKFETICAN